MNLDGNATFNVQEEPNKVKEKLSQQQSASTKPAAPSKLPTELVSILTRSEFGGNSFLVNVPRNVATRCKVGSRLRTQDSGLWRYIVTDNKLHPPVEKYEENTPRNTIENTPTPKWIGLDHITITDSGDFVGT